MKIVPCEQNSLEWLRARAGIPTASEFDQLVTPKGELRTGEMPRSYLARKLAEAWLGGPLPGYQSIDMELGQILEEEAIPFYELERSTSITRVGFVTTDDGRLGCSPDGLLGDQSGLEIKCPAAHTHVACLLAGQLPAAYVLQVQGAMLVTGRAAWQFLSYRRRFPALLLEIERDEKLIAVLRAALDAFLERLDAGLKRLTELNGGPPARFAAPPAPPEPNPIDLMP